MPFQIILRQTHLLMPSKAASLQVLPESVFTPRWKWEWCKVSQKKYLLYNFIMMTNKLTETLPGVSHYWLNSKLAQNSYRYVKLEWRCLKAKLGFLCLLSPGYCWCYSFDKKSTHQGQQDCRVLALQHLSNLKTCTSTVQHNVLDTLQCRITYYSSQPHQYTTFWLKMVIWSQWPLLNVLITGPVTVLQKVAVLTAMGGSVNKKISIHTVV